MTLPVLSVPTYTLEIPSTKKSVKYRPFLVKEEKIILIAMQEMDGKIQVIVDAIKQIIKNCTFGALDTDVLTSYDLEYIFLQLKKKSSGAEVDLAFACQNEVAGQVCAQVNNIKLNLDDVKLTVPVNRSNKIMLAGSIGVVLKDPTLEDAAIAQEVMKSGDLEKIYEIVYGFIDTIFDGETIYEEYTKDELKEFIEALPGDQFQKIRDYFDTAPTLKTDLHIKCKKCGHEETVTLEGLQSFLA